MANAGFVRVASPLIPSLLASRRLGAGEEAVLALAMSLMVSVPDDVPASVTIIDDGEGRAAAKAFGVPVVGTIGVLLQAKREGRISEIAPILRGLQSVGLFLPLRSVLTELLNGVGEEWT